MASSLEQHQPPAFFVRGPSPFARLVFFGAFSLALMLVDARLHYLTEIRQGLAALVYPLEVVAGAPVSAYRGVSEYLTLQRNLVAENRQLRQQNLQRGAELQRFRTLQQENVQLRELFGVASQLPQPPRLGEIVYAGRDPFSRKVVINLGAQHGVNAGQAVTDDLGVIGQITRVYAFTSEVTLVTNKELAVPVQVERSGLRAIAFGNGRENVLDLPYLPVNVDVREGDVLVTSGIDGVYPSGLAVARVKLVDRRSLAPFARIVCTPVAGIDSHRQVLVVAPAASQRPPPPPSVPAVARKPHAPG